MPKAPERTYAADALSRATYLLESCRNTDGGVTLTAAEAQRLLETMAQIGRD